VELDAEEEDFSVLLEELSVFVSFLDSEVDFEAFLDSAEGFEPFSPLESPLPFLA